MDFSFLICFLRKTGCGGRAAEMPRSAALPRLRTRRGNNEIREQQCHEIKSSNLRNPYYLHQSNEIRINNPRNPYNPHTIVPLQGASISRYAILDVFSYKCEKILSPAAKFAQSGCKAAFMNAPSLLSVTHGKSLENFSILS